MTAVSFELENIRNIRITIKLVKKKSNKLKVSYAAHREAVRLKVGVHVAEATVEVQVQADSGIVLRTTPIVAE